MATTMEFCTQQTYARVGVLDTLCAICAAGQHVVLPFKTQERGNAGKKHASGHLGSARSLIQVQNGYAASISRAVS